MHASRFGSVNFLFKYRNAITRCLKSKLEFDFEKIIRQKAWLLAILRRFSRRVRLASGIRNHFEMVSNAADIKTDAIRRFLANLN